MPGTDRGFGHWWFPGHWSDRPPERNSNIVVADEVLNEAMANDGQGGFIKCTDRQQVLDYGESRLKPDRLSRKATDDALITRGPDIGKMGGGTLTTSLFVCHLPKSMCIEIPNYYPRFHQDGKPMLDPATGVQMRRSRWVARDRGEARRFFEAEVAYLAEHVIPGGQEAILGYDIQHSESTPHIQIVADTLAEDPNKPGKLRWDASRAYYSHRDVTVPVLDETGQPVMRTDKAGNTVLDADGNPMPKRRMIQGKEKMSAYHEGLKAHLVGLGYDISPDFDELRHLTDMGKAEYEASQDAKALAEAQARATQELVATASAELDQKRAESERWFDDRRAQLDEREDDLNATEATLVTRAASLDARAANLDNKSARLDEREADVDRRLQQAEQARRDAAVSAAALRAQVERLKEVPADIDRWLDSKASKDGRTFRDIFDRTAAERRERTARLNRVVEQHTGPDHGPELG